VRDADARPMRLIRSVAGARRPLHGLVVVSAPVLALLWLSGCASRPPGAMRGTADFHDWSVVMQLATGSTVRVEETTRNAIAGRLVRADGGEVTTATGADVQRLFVIERLTAMKAKRGWLVGTIAGGLVGGFLTKSNRVPWTLFMSAGWGAFGAGIGASDGFFDRKESLVYEAQPVARSASVNQVGNIGLQPTTASAIMVPSRLKPQRWQSARPMS
jgi:hypothetical protein